MPPLGECHFSLTHCLGSVLFPSTHPLGVLYLILQIYTHLRGLQNKIPSEWGVGRPYRPPHLSSTAQEGPCFNEPALKGASA